jgi:hypothetical protein
MSALRDHQRSAAASALCAIASLAIAACTGAAPIARPSIDARTPVRTARPIPGTSSYERRWGNVCGPGRRAPARPEQYRAQVEQLTGPTGAQLSAALLIIPEGSNRWRSAVVSNAPPDIAAELEVRWRAHAKDAAHCFGVVADGFETFPIADGVVAPYAPDASPRSRCVHRILRSALAGLTLSGAEGFAVLYGREAVRVESQDRAARSKSVTGSMTKAQIKRGIDAGATSIRSCYEQALVVWPRIAGRVMTRFIIAPDGTVDSSEITSSELGKEAVECCISSTMATLVFDPPQGGGIVVVSFPYIFEPAP